MLSCRPLTKWSIIGIVGDKFREVGMGVIQEIVNLELDALRILCLVYSPPKGPFRKDDANYYKEILLEQRGQSILAKLQQEQKDEVEFARRHGQERVHGAKDISQEYVKQRAMEEINSDLDRIKNWICEGKDAKAEFEKAIEK